MFFTIFLLLCDPFALTPCLFPAVYLCICPLDIFTFQTLPLESRNICESVCSLTSCFRIWFGMAGKVSEIRISTGLLCDFEACAPQTTLKWSRGSNLFSPSGHDRRMRHHVPGGGSRSRAVSGQWSGTPSQQTWWHTAALVGDIAYPELC